MKTCVLTEIVLVACEMNRLKDLSDHRSIVRETAKFLLLGAFALLKLLLEYKT